MGSLKRNRKSQCRALAVVDAIAFDVMYAPTASEGGMKDFHLRFCLDTKGWYTHLFNLWVDPCRQLLLAPKDRAQTGLKLGPRARSAWANLSLVSSPFARGYLLR